MQFPAGGQKLCIMKYILKNRLFKREYSSAFLSVKYGGLEIQIFKLIKTPSSGYFLSIQFLMRLASHRQIHVKVLCSFDEKITSLLTFQSVHQSSYILSISIFTLTNFKSEEVSYYAGSYINNRGVRLQKPKVIHFRAWQVSLVLMSNSCGSYILVDDSSKQ